jgi:hypothetical protein
MPRRDLSVKGGTSERCYRMRRGRTGEQRYAIISPYFDGCIKMNGPYPEITNISFLAKLFFKTFISLKHLSDYRTVGLSDYRTVRPSDYSYGPHMITVTSRSKMIVRAVVFNATFNNISVTSWRTVLLEYQEKTTYLPQVTDKLYHIMLYREHLAWCALMLNIYDLRQVGGFSGSSGFLHQ